MVDASNRLAPCRRETGLTRVTRPTEIAQSVVPLALLWPHLLHHTHMLVDTLPFLPAASGLYCLHSTSLSYITKRLCCCLRGKILVRRCSVPLYAPLWTYPRPSLTRFIRCQLRRFSRTLSALLPVTSSAEALLHDTLLSWAPRCTRTHSNRVLLAKYFSTDLRSNSLPLPAGASKSQNNGGTADVATVHTSSEYTSSEYLRGQVR